MANYAAPNGSKAAISGGFPLEFPVMSLGEALMRPTTMLFRNLASMDVEETIRANPLDGVVLLTGRPMRKPNRLTDACEFTKFHLKF